MKKIINEVNELIDSKINKLNQLKGTTPKSVGRNAIIKELPGYIKELEKIKKTIEDYDIQDFESNQDWKKDTYGILRDGEGNKIDQEIYIIKVAGKPRRHILIPGKKGYCPACNKKKKTTAHHPLPKRMDIKNQHFKDLRIKICDDCHEEVHPEGKLIVATRLIKEILEDFTENGTDVIDKYRELLNFIRKDKGLE